MKSHATYWSEIKEIRDKALVTDTYASYVDGAKEIQRLIDECCKELHIHGSDSSLIIFRHFRNELDEKAEEIVRARREAELEAERREERRRQEERERAMSNSYCSYDPFYRSPAEERLWEEDSNGYSHYVNDDGDVWGWESMSS